MRRLSDTQIGALRNLRHNPATAYEIRYPVQTMQKLVDLGLASTHLPPDTPDCPWGRVYTITDAGRAAIA